MEWFEILTPWHWLTTAVIIIVLEMMIGTYYLLWVGFAAAATALVQWIFGIGWQLQMIVFFILSLASIAAWYYYAKKNPEVDVMPNLNKRGKQFIGRNFNLSKAIVNGEGKINVNDSTWKVEATNDLPEGAKVRVTEVVGTILKVEKV